MMNDMMPTIEETITPDIAAEIEHREWERGNEQRERWEAIEAIHGPLFTPREWAEHCADYDSYLESRGTSFAEVQEKSRQLGDDLENAYKCDDDEDEVDWQGCSHFDGYE